MTKQNTYPLVIESSFQLLKTSEYNKASIPSLVKVLYHLYTDSRTFNITMNWNSNKVILSTMDKMAPFIPSIEDRILNSLIISLGFMGIGQHPIWKPIETKFIASSHSILDRDYIPISVSAFSISKCENQALWDILLKRLSDEFLSNYHLSGSTASLVYKSLLYSGQGTQAIINKLKSFILSDINDIKQTSVSGILGALSYSKQVDYELTKPILNQLLLTLKDYDANELCRILGNLNLLLQDKKLCEKIENEIINRKDELSIKEIVSCFTIYSQKRVVSMEFPKRIFGHYVKYRNLMMRKVEGEDTMAAYDMRMLGCALEMSLDIPDAFFLQVLEFIKKSKIKIGSSKNLQANKKMIDNYILFHKFKA